MASGQAAAKSKLYALNGLFAVYKKQGPTSADVLNTLKIKLLEASLFYSCLFSNVERSPELSVTEAGIKHNPRKRKKQALKLGHGGTLDSPASGVLVVGIGNGTKMLASMLTGSKKYTAVGELGKATDTLDATGSITREEAYDHITREAFEEKLKKFTGDIMQVPPLYSALKRDGQRLSVLLKQGHQVEAKPARAVTVYSLTLQDFSPPLFTLDIECGGGFYVRSLVDDLGKELASCAHVKELIRTKQGQFNLAEHALPEERWTIDEVARSLQPCPSPSNPEPGKDSSQQAEPQDDHEDQENVEKES